MLTTRSRWRGQVAEQPPLGIGQVHRLAVPPHAGRVVVDHQVAHRDGDPTGPAPAQHGVHPGHQLGHGERLDQIVVRPGAEPVQPVGRGVPGGQHQHGRGAGSAAPPPAARTRPARQHHVQDHQVRPEDAEPTFQVGPVGGRRRPRTRGPDRAVTTGSRMASLSSTTRIRAAVTRVILAPRGRAPVRHRRAAGVQGGRPPCAETAGRALYADLHGIFSVETGSHPGSRDDRRGAPAGRGPGRAPRWSG